MKSLSSKHMAFPRMSADICILHLVCLPLPDVPCQSPLSSFPITPPQYFLEARLSAASGFLGCLSLSRLSLFVALETVKCRWNTSFMFPASGNATST